MFSRTLLVILLGTLVPPVKASDLTSMLSLSRDITNKPPSWRFDVDPCQWQAVVCNATGSVTGIDWASLGLGGFANLTILPAGLSYLYLNNNQLTGNGTFSSPHVWCSQQLGMCGVGTPGVFNCTSGVWRCGAAW